eukprot:scaffold3529_cov101-Skeletonema_dohrnii-CCMP3373.AAC.6
MDIPLSPAALDEPREEGAEMFTIVTMIGRWALFKRALLQQPTRASLEERRRGEASFGCMWARIVDRGPSDF